MRQNSKQRKLVSGDQGSQLSAPLKAFEIRGERFDVKPEKGYIATVILLAEYRTRLNELKDLEARARIVYNVAKLGRGLSGDWKEVGGAYEMRIDYGPGYRVYFGKISQAVFIVALAGDKSTQTADIATAMAILDEVKNDIKEIRK